MFEEPIKTHINSDLWRVPRSVRNFLEHSLNNEETQHTMKITPVNNIWYYQSPKGNESELERGDKRGTPTFHLSLG